VGYFVGRIRIPQMEQKWRVKISPSKLAITPIYDFGADFFRRGFVGVSWVAFESHEIIISWRFRGGGRGFLLHSKPSPPSRGLLRFKSEGGVGHSHIRGGEEWDIPI